MNDALTRIAEEITMVRKLAVFALLNSGVSQEQLASALGVSQATISRLAGSATQTKRKTKAKKNAKR